MDTDKKKKNIEFSWLASEEWNNDIWWIKHIWMAPDRQDKFPKIFFRPQSASYKPIFKLTNQTQRQYRALFYKPSERKCRQENHIFEELNCSWKDQKKHFISVQFTVSCPTLWPHESQHARPPCPSPTPGVHSNSWPSSRWCHPAISSSVVPFSFCPQSLPTSGFFTASQLFTWGGQSIGVWALKTLESPLDCKEIQPVHSEGD